MIRNYPLEKLQKLFGFELEFFLVDEEGNIQNRADEMIEKIKLKETELKKECGHAMLEVASFPHMSSRHIFSRFFEDYEELIYRLGQEGLSPYYYGTYPGKNTNTMRTTARYKAKAKILGSKNFEIAGKCIGLHYHYSLPRKSFNHKLKFFYLDIKKSNQQKVLNVNNLFIALDPAVTNLMQSSPYFEGELLGKDSRMMVYRGDEGFGTSGSLYEEKPEYGTLNHYSSTFKDLKDRVRDRAEEWKKELKAHGHTFSEFIKREPSILDSSWKPVKITPHGTIESRGADMNSPRRVASFAVMMKNLTHHINSNNIEIKPCQEGNDEPFKIEGSRMLVPEEDWLRKKLQVDSALKGMESRWTYEYSRALLRTCGEVFPKDQRWALNPLIEMVEEKKTESDIMIDFVKKKQGYSDHKILREDTARELAIETSRNLFKDILFAKKYFSDI